MSVWQIRAGDELIWRNNIGAKFVAVVIIVLSVTTTVAAIAQSWWATEEIADQRRDSVRHTVNIAGAALTEAILALDYLSLDRYVAELAQQLDVQYAVVRDARGSIMAAGMVDPARGYLTTKAAAAYIPAIEAESEKISSVIDHDRRAIGNIEVGLGRGSIDVFLWRNLTEHLLTNLLITIVLSSVIYVAFSRYVLRPVRVLQRSCRDVANGDLGREIPLYQQDELGSLAGSFRAMVESLRRTLDERQNMLDELRTVNDRLEGATRAKSAFLANMSHELRTPLNAIIGYSEMIMDDMDDAFDAQKRLDLQKVSQAGKHLLSLINEVLDLSKIEAGRMDVYLEESEIAKIVREVKDIIDPLAMAKGLDLTVDVAADIGVMRADVTKLRQCLVNLMSNAVKFTETGVVGLRCGHMIQDGIDWITFEAHDTGIGISPSQQTKLFHEFVQADNSTTRKYGGTGLGLALTKRYVEMLGGSVRVESEPNRGSRFIVRLPRVGIDNLPADPATARMGDTRRSHISTVLIMERSDAMQRRLRYYLNSEGFHVSAATSAVDAIRRSAERPPDVVTLDILAEDLSGWALLGALKASPELRDLPVVIFSTTDHGERGFVLATADILPKPFDAETLRAVLGRVGSSSGGRNLILVDESLPGDEAFLAQTKGWGWSTVAAPTADEAYTQLDSLPGAVLVLDLNLPDAEAFHVIRKLSGHKRWRDTPVLVVGNMDPRRFRGAGYASMRDAALAYAPHHGSQLYDVLREEVRKGCRIIYSVKHATNDVASKGDDGLA